MNIGEKLNKVWTQDYINQLPNFVKERGFVFSENNSNKDILITGINPSFRQGAGMDSYGFDFQRTFKEIKWDNYWGPLIRILHDTEKNIDLRDRSGYLDIFYFREKEQLQLRNGILKSPVGIRFLVDQLIITQHIIEDIIRPKVIVVKNRESAAFWGKLAEQGIYWMGYQLDHIQDFACGELFQISGFTNSNERIAPEIKETSLKNSLVLFTHHINQYLSKEKRPTATIINDLLERHHSSENIM
jgi:hypothetical protein